MKTEKSTGRINLKKVMAAALICAFIAVIPADIRITAQTPVYQIRVTNMRFINGIGRGPTSTGTDNIAAYYRGYGMPGTLMELTAEMSLDGGATWGAPVYGNVQFAVSFTDGASTGQFNITMPSGAHTVTGAVPYDTGSGFDGAWIAASSTSAWTYSVVSATGDYVENSGLPASIISAAAETINWDRNDPPYPAGTPAITVNQVVISATSVTLYWTPYSTVSTGFDQDFFEYRIYYREENSSAFKQWNRSHDPSLGGLNNNPAVTPVNDTLRHFDANGWKYTTIPNLKLFTGYEYYITSVDVFGNEISEADAGPAAGSRLVRTLPLQIEAAISDGITSHSDFSDLSNPALRPLREANTRVDIYTVSAVTQPDECIIWFTTTDAPAADAEDIVTPLLEINPAIGNNLDSVAAVRTGPNVWTAYIPTIPSAGKNRIVAEGNSIRFIVELRNRGISTFVDKDSGLSANDAEWTYSIGIPAKLTPWPVRVLNNVITSSSPRAYPSYYLSEDAYVTIRVYDVKGRPVTVLLEDAYRRGGQNIKENGWAGTNKSGNKLGVGLYHVHFRAVSVNSGRVVLDSFKKVVMKR